VTWWPGDSTLGESMKFGFYCFILILVAGYSYGCQTTPKTHPAVSQESTQEVTSAVGSVTEALSGQVMTDEQARQTIRAIQKDKEGQSALRSIADAMDVKKTGVKYCPVDGKHFSTDLDECPEHKVKLQELVE